MPTRDSSLATPPRTARRKLARIAWIALAALVALLVLVEIGARVVPHPGLALDVLDPARKLGEARSVPHPYLAYALKPGWRTAPGAKVETIHNSLGFRGPETTWEKPAGRFRIVCIGGSSTYGNTESSNATTWPARLEVHLREARPDLDVEVLNCGTFGYSTFEALITLAIRALDFQPDLVIVYESINDVRCALYVNPRHPDAPVRNDNSHWRAPWPVDRPSAVERALEHSRAYLVFRRYLTDYAADRADLGYYAIVDYDPKAGNLYANPAPSELGFHSFRRNLESIVSIARGAGAQVVLGTQGNDWTDFEKDSPVSREAQRRGMERCREILREVAAERGVTLVDAASALEAEADRRRAEGNDDVFTWEVHLTDRGADLLARTFAQGILASGLLP